MPSNMQADAHTLMSPDATHLATALMHSYTLLHTLTWTIFTSVLSSTLAIILAWSWEVTHTGPSILTEWLFSSSQTSISEHTLTNSDVQREARIAGNITLCVHACVCVFVCGWSSNMWMRRKWKQTSYSPQTELLLGVKCGWTIVQLSTHAPVSLLKNGQQVVLRSSDVIAAAQKPPPMLRQAVWQSAYGQRMFMLTVFFSYTHSHKQLVSEL